ncbi:MAG: ABC transporter ATP-binding protein [Elusimicrobia bacterium]|nr:ABC transporter ATP-binding protein [Elusimicrobiota bacterium]MDE2236471.1 ABC transporter ATP-binding protein [Elusimicrobiota bacterium]MDE2425910.1 ABC transporter ATP-binding protein [Elusimicrobiota bacterium]
MEPILSVQGLRTQFHAPGRVVRAVDGVSYDLYPGRTLAVVGESGSGKSVHALSILRLLPEPPAKIVSGRILFNGRDLLAMDPEKLRELRGNRIAMIFQEPMTSLNPVMRVGEQIAEAVMLHQNAGRSAAWAKAVGLLEKVGIPHASSRVNDFPHQFSGGMRQRAMIAIALSCEPDVLIADEPTTALDVTIQAQILALIKTLQSELKMALILITHNIGVVAEMADEVSVMYAGRQVEHAPVSELFKNPKHPYTRGLLASVPSIYSRRKRLEAIPGQPPELTREFPGCPFAPRCPAALDRCRGEDPPLFRLPDGRLSNCWLQESEAAGRLDRFEAAAR